MPSLDICNATLLIFLAKRVIGCLIVVVLVVVNYTVSQWLVLSILQASHPSASPRRQHQRYDLHDVTLYDRCLSPTPPQNPLTMTDGSPLQTAYKLAA